MKINDKGFTLVEIIITIGIIGVVAVIAFPAILALQSSNEDTKYEAYTDLLGSNARIYVNSFEKDIFPEDDVDNSCFVLDYETMYNNDLIKDIEIPGVYCNNKSLQDVKTFVKITPDGAGYDYETSIYCYDGSGNMVYESEKKVDTTDCDAIDEDGPSIEIISNTDVSNISNIKYSDYRKDHNYTIKVSDKSGLVDNIEIRYGWGYDGNIPTTYITHSFNNNYGVNEVSFSSNTNDEALINDKNGKWKLYVEVVNVADTEGYSTTDGVSTSFGLDNTAPVTPVINNTNHNKWVNFDYSVTANSSDAGSGIAYYQYSYDGSKWTTYKNSAMNSFPTTKFTKERNQNVYIRACDRLGHCSLNGSSNIKIDKTAPNKPTITNPYNNTWRTAHYNITIKSTDNLSGIAYYRYNYGGSNWTTHANSSGNSFTYKISSDMSKNYYVQSCDYAGNCSSSNYSIIKLDTVAPTCSSSGGSTSWTKNNTTITGTCSDATSKCKGNVSRTFSATTNGNYSPGTVYDNAGNSTVCGARTVRVDKTAPTCTSSGGNSSWSTSSTTIYGYCSDGDSGCVSNVSSTLNNANGWYSPGTVRDKVGNTTSCPGVTAYTDTTPPPAPIFQSVVNIRFYTPTATINYSECIGKGGKYQDESCNVYFHVGNDAGISFSLKRQAADAGPAYPVSYEQNIWTHAYPGSSAGYCDSWFTEDSGQCSDWRHAPCASYARCSSVATWGTHCVRSVDTAGRAGNSLCVTYHYTWGK